MPPGERRVADPVSQAVQVLPGIGVESSEKLLQLQGEALERVRQSETEQREEHIRAKHSVRVAESGSKRAEDTGDRAREEVEAQQVQPGRGVQGLRPLRGGGHARAGHADRGRDSRFRHGRAHSSTGLAIHPRVRQKDSGLVAGRGPAENKEYTHRQSAVRV